jgi:hypothetical protein
MQQHEERDLHLLTELGQTAVQIRVQPEPHPAAPVARRGRPRPVGREGELFGQVLELAEPVAELPARQAVRAAVLGELLMLPQREVGVLDRQFRPGRIVAS